MLELFTVRIRTESPSAAERFVREYVIERFDDIRASEHCERFTFYFTRDPETEDRSLILLSFAGDRAAILEQEGPRWDSLQADGKLNEWEAGEAVGPEKPKEVAGEKGWSLGKRLNQLEGQIAKLAYEEFETFPEPVDTYPDEESDGPIGFWDVPHTVMVQLNYSLEEELAVYEYGIEHTLRNIAEYEGPDDAEARLDEVIDELEAKREAIREGRLDS